jgi:anti-sigma factor RsiW
MEGGPIHEDDLLAYVDGCLDAERRRTVEQWLAQNPAVARRVAADLAINAGLRRLFGQPDRPARSAAPLQAAAALALVAAGAAAGWTLAGGWGVMPAPVEPEQRAAEASAAPSGAAADALVAGLRRIVRPPDLSSAGLRLVGQAAVGGGERTTLRLTYEGSDGNRVTLFVQLRDDPGASYRQDQQVLMWTDGPLAFALAGDRPGGELRVLAELVRWAPRGARRAAPVVPVAGGGSQ